MRIVCAPDSFKHSMSALTAALAMAAGVRRVQPNARCDIMPMADGGEGTTQAIVDAVGGQLVRVDVRDALGRPQRARYGIVPTKLAVIEVAQAAGLELIAPDERDPLAASTYGVGQMIRDALNRGARRLIVGLGGSATNDGGAGLLAALGARLLGIDGRPLPPGGGPLLDLMDIDLTGLDARLASRQIDLACDVDNPLLGPQGASAVFGPQKGASPAQVELLDRALTRFADVLEAAAGRRVRDLPGAGAAGGLGVPLLALTDARIRPGVEIVAEAVGLAARVAGADYVFTGEGSLDAQTLRGKTPLGVLRVAEAAGVPVVMFGGRVDDVARRALRGRVIALMPVTPPGVDLDDALRRAPEFLADAAELAASMLVGTS